MIKGDNVLIHYTSMNKEIMATFYGNENGNYLFNDSTGLFLVSERAVKEERITLEVIEDF